MPLPPSSVPQQPAFGPNERSFRATQLWDRALQSLSPEVKSLISFGHNDKRDILEDVCRLAQAKRVQCMKSRWKIRRSNGESIILRDVFEKVAKFAQKAREIGDVAVQFDPAHASLPWAGVRLMLQVVINETSAFAAMMDGMEKAANCISRYTIVDAIYLRQPSAATEHLVASLVEVYASILTFLGKSIKFFDTGTAKRVVANSLGHTDRVIAELVETIANLQLNVERDAMLVQGVRQLGLADITASLLAQVKKQDFDLVQDALKKQEALIMYEGMKTRADLGNWTRTAQYMNSVMSENIKTNAELRKLLQIASDLNSPLYRTAVSLQQLVDDRTEAQRLEILMWASKVPYRQHHSNIRRGRITGTGRWVLSKPEFVHWQLSSCSSILWVHGVPGSGKTVLASALIDWLIEENTASKYPPPVAYFYCSRNPAEPERGEPVEILASIARQLASEDASMPLRKPLVSLYQKTKGHGFGMRKMDIEEAIGLIVALNNENPAYIVIDGLDECDPTTRFELLEGLDTILQESNNVVKVFVTSRPDSDISCRLKSVPNIFIKAEDNQSDIQHFVEIELSNAIRKKRLLRGNVSGDLQDEISRTLQDGAQGMFRWVSLQLQNLCNPQRVKLEEDLLSELGQMPKSLSEVYDVIHEQVLQSGPVSKLMATRSLQWMMVARRPLKPIELIAGITRTDTRGKNTLQPQDLPGLTCNLLYIDESLDIVRFAHVSVREYLELRAEYSLDESHMHVVLSCLTLYQSVDPPRRTSRGDMRAPPSIYTAMLRSYASCFWPAHASRIKENSRREVVIAALRGVILDDLGTSDSFNEWRRHIAEFATPSESVDSAMQSCVTGFHTCCVFGFPELLRQCNRMQIKRYNFKVMFRNPTDEYHGWSAFHMAIDRGYPAVVDVLLRAGVDCNEATLGGLTPVYLAVRANHHLLVPLLASFGSDLNRCVPLDPIAAVMVTTYHGTEYEHLPTRMGNRGADGRVSSAIDEEEESPMHHAASRGYRNCIVELLKCGANIDIKNNVSLTPMIKSLESGKYEALQYLLDQGADVNQRLLYGRTALHLAAASGDIKAAKILLQSGADPHLGDWLRSTPVQIARRYQHDAMAKMLNPSGEEPVTDESDSSQDEDEDADITLDLHLGEEPPSDPVPAVVVSEWDRLVHGPSFETPPPALLPPSPPSPRPPPDNARAIRRKPVPNRV